MDMKLTIQPVVFGGVDWTSRAKLGMEPTPTPLERARRRLAELAGAIEDVEWLDVCEVNSPDETGRLVEASRQADLVLALASELLVVKTTARALASVSGVVALTGDENVPYPVFADVYGSLRADGVDAYLALNAADLAGFVRGLRAQKMLAATRALLIGDGYPSHSQVSNPDSPRVVADRLGVEICQRSIDDLRARWESADEDHAREQAEAWLEGANEVADEARRDIVQCAKMYLAMKTLMAETATNALTIDCRTWDLISCEEFGAFYSPCMGLTTLRWEGIPASCEADLCAMLTMCLLRYVSGLPAFLGNIGRVFPERGSVQVGGHAACTVDMEGAGRGLVGYALRDYGGRGGVASYCPIEAGRPVTIARLDKTCRRLSVAVGETIATEQGFEVTVGDVSDFIHRCLTGDHYIVVYGHHLEVISHVAERMGIELLVPRPAPGE
ncbi:MAG: hypothetical protein J7M38_01400 [Armatimonadetes bacterium]|nr:hypothetical protein [Armatimonadota bacterium]